MPFRSLPRISRQKLERDGLTEFQVVGTINLTHTPFAQESDDAIAVAEKGARKKTTVIDRAG